MNEIKPGDVVRLKSGGPNMVVGSFERGMRKRKLRSDDPDKQPRKPRLKCHWVSDDGCPQYSYYPEVALKLELSHVKTKEGS